MIADAARSALPDELHAEVIIVGSGPAGLTLALELASAGIDVIVVEAGGERYDADAQDAYRAASVEPASHGPTQMFRRRNFGGSTAIWGGRCIPFGAIDFERRPWIAHSEWPITFEDVAAHYPRAAELCDAGPALFDAGRALPGSPAPMVPGVATPDVILDNIERFSLPTDFGRRHRGRLKSDPHIRLFLHAPVLRVLTHDAGNRAAGVLVQAGGRPSKIMAPRVVIAAGGLETPRLLLASDQDRTCGLGNERDLVGRFYQCHLEGEIGRIAFHAPAEEIRADYERSPEGVYCRRYASLSAHAQRRAGLSGLAVRPNHANIVDPAHGDAVLSAMYIVKDLIVPEYARKLTTLESAELEGGTHGSAVGFYGAHLRNMALGAPALLAFSSRWARKRVFARRKLPSVFLPDRRAVYPLEVNAEQEPNPNSRVVLAKERDALGMRRIGVDWRTTDRDHQRLRDGLLAMQAALATSRTVRLDFDGLDLEALSLRKTPVGGHHIGTARMGETAATGVCDANGELFGTRGVFIAGAASFTTSSYANPTLTIVALALRMAKHLAAATRPA